MNQVNSSDVDRKTKIRKLGSSVDITVIIPGESIEEIYLNILKFCCSIFLYSVFAKLKRVPSVQAF